MLVKVKKQNKKIRVSVILLLLMLTMFLHFVYRNQNTAMVQGECKQPRRVNIFSFVYITFGHCHSYISLKEPLSQVTTTSPSQSSTPPFTFFLNLIEKKVSSSEHTINSLHYQHICLLSIPLNVFKHVILSPSLSLSICLYIYVLFYIFHLS